MKCILVVSTIFTVVGATLVSAANVGVTIHCVGTISYESVNPEEDADDVGNDSSDTFDCALENIDGCVTEEQNIVVEKTRHVRLQP